MKFNKVLLFHLTFLLFISCSNEGRFKSLNNQKAPWLMVDTSTGKICISQSLKASQNEAEIFWALNDEIGEAKYCDGSDSPMDEKLKNFLK